MTSATLQSSTTSDKTPKAYQALIERVRDAHLLGATGGILSWDQETMMPAGGVELRSQQLAILARLQHQMSTHPLVGELISQCEADRSFMESNSVESANIVELRRDFDQATKLPERLISEFAEVSSKAQHEWATARKASDFKMFLPWLEKLVALNREKAACLGIPAGGEPWDALADTYEPGCTAASVTKVFTPLRARLVKLLGDLMGGSRRP